MAPTRTRADAILDVVRAGGGPPVVVLTGRTGTGKSTLLTMVGTVLRDQGRTVIGNRITRDGIPVEWRDDESTRRRDPSAASAWGTADAHEHPLLAPRAARAVAASLEARDGVLLVDDVQWAGPAAVAALDALARRLDGTAVRCVCTVTVPCPAPVAASGAATLERLRALGLATSVRVTALDADDTSRTVQQLLKAVPSPDLVAHVRARSRGIAAAVRDVVMSLRAVGAVRLVAGHAYLVAPGPDDHPGAVGSPLLENVRSLGRRAWRTARTAAALEPAGPALPALLSAALETSVDDALVRLHELRAAGIVHHTRDGGWRFPVPALADRLRDVLGPYERRRLAALVVTAVWRGEAQLPRPELADLVATAGRLLPAERAHAELVAAASPAVTGSPRRVAQWWQAAAELAEREDDRVRAGLEHARACWHAGDAPAFLATARRLLEDGSALPEGPREELLVQHVLGLHTNGETEELDRIADGDALREGDEAIRSICRVVAHALRGRWVRALSLLAHTRPTWEARSSVREIGELLWWVGELFAGRLRTSSGPVFTGPAGSADSVHGKRAKIVHSCLVALGDVRALHDVPHWFGISDPALLLPHGRAVHALLEGRPEASELARRALVERGAPRVDLGGASFYQLFAGLALAKGQLTRSRELITAGRAETLVLDHVLDVPQASIDLVLGAVDAARARLAAALDRAHGHDLVVGTELVLSLLVEVCLRSGDVAAARARAQQLGDVAARLQSPRAVLHAAFGRARAYDDADSAATCLRLARESGQSYEGAHLALRLAAAGLVDPAVLTDVYAFYGRLDVPLARSWTRAVMEACGVPVPGRAVTKAENERLLGQLLIEGLSNRQIATVLGHSEKSVEGRLGRLYARTGYRSRIELAASLLNGGYAG